MSLGSMKAIGKALPKRGAQLQDMPIPVPGPREVLIQAKATSICETDLNNYEWGEWAQQRVRLPKIMGHEFAGEGEEVGAEVAALHPGDFVSAESHIYCGVCFQCRTGRAEVCQNIRILGGGRSRLLGRFRADPRNQCLEEFLYPKGN